MIRSLSGRACQCATCGEFFNSDTMFGRHRVGHYERGSTPSSRRCLSVAEMLAKGWARNRRGLWVSRLRQETFPVSLEASRSAGDLRGCRPLALIGKDMAMGTPPSGDPINSRRRSLEEAPCD